MKRRLTSCDRKGQALNTATRPQYSRGAPPHRRVQQGFTLIELMGLSDDRLQARVGCSEQDVQNKQSHAELQEGKAECLFATRVGDA